MAVCCTCGHVLQRFWVAWDDRQQSWRVSVDSPDTSRTDSVYAASRAEAEFAIHHDRGILTHDAVCPPRAQPGWRAYGPAGHGLATYPTALIPPDHIASSHRNPGLPAA